MNSPGGETGTPSKADPPNRDPAGRTVGSVDSHPADVVARARARLAALVRRPPAPSIQRIAGLMPGVAARIDQSEAAAYDEAARDAFRAATTLEPATPPARPPMPVPASASEGEPPMPSVSIRTTPGVTRAAPGAPSTTPVNPAIPTAESRTPTSWSPRPFTPITPRISRAAEPGPHSAGSAAGGGHQPAGRRRHQAGETAPEDLLRPPESADSAAGDFFDGLVRLVEDKR
jgi:hypothetical protein